MTDLENKLANSLQECTDKLQKEYQDNNALRKAGNACAFQRDQINHRLKVAEKIMAHFYAESDDPAPFLEYCKLCSNNEDCEWGDDFPDCFTDVKTSTSSKNTESH